MAYVSKMDNMLLMILNDCDAESPREWDNNGNMVCWHNKYNLGDEHDYSDSYRLFMEYLYENESSDNIIKIAKQTDTIDIRYNRKDCGYSIYHKEYGSPSFDEYAFIDGKMEDIKDELAYLLLDIIPIGILKAEFEKNNLLLPLYLYEHSGITMNTTGFNCSWDSGQVGYIYRSYKDIEENVAGNSFDEKLERARKNLIDEVSVYDKYLTGEIYGFKYFENGDEKENCWGFYGSSDEIKDEIASYLPNKAHCLLKDMTYVYEREAYSYEEEYGEEYREMELVQ